MPNAQTHLQNVTEALISPIADRVGNVVAVGAITSPLWRDRLHDFSGIAADIVPLLGCVWLAVQIGFKVFGPKSKE